MHTTVLITGFEPFGQVLVNPSALICESLVCESHDMSRYRRAGEILPTEFVAAGRRMRDLIRTLRPDVVIELGVAPTATGLRFERVATNLDDATIPDNAGYQPASAEIVAGGVPTLAATLPLAQMLDRVTELGVPASFSEDAGAYMCNHVMYCALDEIARLALPAQCGLIHVPLCSEYPAGNRATEAPALTLAQLVAAVDSCVQSCRR
jgi:pyroglutamyl-peptidase